MRQRFAIAAAKQLSALQFAAEALFGWRRLLAPIADVGTYQPADIDRLAGALRADFVRLPALRFLDLDPVSTYTASKRLFRWAQQVCGACAKQSECSLLVVKAKTLPRFEQYCSNAAAFRQKMGEQISV